MANRQTPEGVFEPLDANCLFAARARDRAMWRSRAPAGGFVSMTRYLPIVLGMVLIVGLTIPQVIMTDRLAART